MLVLLLPICLFSTLALIIHELGHLLAARRYGIRASELALGVGPRLFGFSVGSVRFNLRALPLGSFVRLDGTALKSKPLSAQLCVHVAGIVFNLIAGIATFGTRFGWINLLVAAGNILPIYQHDGWKCGLVIMRSVMRKHSPPAEWAFTFSGCFVSVLLGWVVIKAFI